MPDRLPSSELLEEKALRYGRAVVKVGRFFPVEPDLLRLRSPGWPEAIEYPGMDVRPLRSQVSPRHQCRKEHSS